MAQKSDFKTVETDLDELEEKIRKHRRKIAKRIIIVVAAVVGFIFKYKEKKKYPADPNKPVDKRGSRII